MKSHRRVERKRHVHHGGGESAAAAAAVPPAPPAPAPRPPGEHNLLDGPEFQAVLKRFRTTVVDEETGNRLRALMEPWFTNKLSGIAGSVLADLDATETAQGQLNVMTGALGTTAIVWLWVGIIAGVATVKERFDPAWKPGDPLELR